MAPEEIGRYRIVGQLGSGAMGVVYRGYDPLLERTVAIKTIKLDLPPEERDAFEQRFFQEAKSAGRLNHPNIVTVYDAGQAGDMTYIAMEFLEGRDLRQLMVKDKPIPPELAVDIVTGIAEGLAYAHRHGVVHRDVKPANIMVLQNGSVKLADFGIAHLQSGTKTHTTTVLGTPTYMAPEQFAGKPVDGRSDIFSLGVILYELLTGRAPFDAETVAGVMYRVVRKPARAPSSILHLDHPWFDYILSKALAKEPENRYQTASEFATDLRRHRKLLDQEPLAWPTGGLAPRSRKAYRRSDRAENDERIAPANTGSKARWLLGAAAVALIGGGLAFFLSREDKAPQAPANVAVAPETPPPVAPPPAADSGPPSPAAPPAPAATPAPSAPAAAKPATLTLAIAPWGEVYVDRERKGISPPLTRLQLPAGQHRIEIRNAGAAPLVREVTLSEGETLRLKHKF